MCPLSLCSLARSPVDVCPVEGGSGGCAVLGEVSAVGASRAMQHVRSNQKACLVFSQIRKLSYQDSRVSLCSALGRTRQY